MNFSIITVSLPIDEETYKEINDFYKKLSKSENQPFDKLSNLSIAQDERKGFYVLAYDEKVNEIIGVINAIDYIGVHVYEWSISIDPMYRNIGIEENLLNVLSQGLQQRGAEGEIVVLLERDHFGKKLMEQYGYSYNYSEVMLETTVEFVEKNSDIAIRQYNEKTDFESLIEIYQYAFGDMREESIELIHFTIFSEAKTLWVAEKDGKVIGTITTTNVGNNQWITAFAVHPKLRGKGIGTALLQWVKKVAFENEIEKLMLEVEIENEQALSVYEKAGFYKRIQKDYFIYEG